MGFPGGDDDGVGGAWRELRRDGRGVQRGDVGVGDDGVAVGWGGGAGAFSSRGRRRPGAMEMVYPGVSMRTGPLTGGPLRGLRLRTRRGAVGLYARSGDTR